MHADTQSCIQLMSDDCIQTTYFCCHFRRAQAISKLENFTPKSSEGCGCFAPLLSRRYVLLVCWSESYLSIHWVDLEMWTMHPKMWRVQQRQHIFATYAAFQNTKMPKLLPALQSRLQLNHLLETFGSSRGIPHSFGFWDGRKVIGITVEERLKAMAWVAWRLKSCACRVQLRNLNRLLSVWMFMRP